MTGLAAIALLILIALLEAAVPALRSRRLPPRQSVENAARRLRRRFATEPRRARRASWLLRIMLIGAVAACVLLAPVEIRMTVALIAVAGFGLLLALTAAGALRRTGRQSEIAARVMLWPLAPLFFLLPAAPRGQAAATHDPDETIADIADALASESAERQLMVEALLDLERKSVEDVMVPRSEIEGIDFAADWDEISGLLRRTQHTRMPLYDGDLDRVHGIVHMRLVANEIAAGRLTHERLREIAGQREALFTPEGTTLYAQLLRFRRLRRRIAFVVDEYGGVRGLVTLEDILEEVVGEFTTQPALPQLDFSARPDGSTVVPGGVTLRAVNRALGMNLPTDGPRTLSGLIVEQLEAIPEPGARLTLGGRTVEVLQVADNAVRTARILPANAGE